MSHIRELGGGVVSPDGDVPDGLGLDTQSGGNLRLSSVLVQTSQTREVRGRNRWSRLLTQETISIGRISHDKDLFHVGCNHHINITTTPA